MSVARSGRPTAACRCVVVRPQRNKRPRDTRAGAPRAADARSKSNTCGRGVTSNACAGDAMGVVREVGVGTGRAGGPVADGSSSSTPKWIRLMWRTHWSPPGRCSTIARLRSEPNRDELLSGLAAIASGAPAPNVVTGKAIRHRGNGLRLPRPGIAVDGHGGRTVGHRTGVRR